MSRLVLAAAIPAAFGEAVLRPKLIQVALGYPLSFCPKGILATAITAGHFIALGCFVSLVLFVVRFTLPMPWRVVWAATVGSVAAAGILWWILSQQPVRAWIVEATGSVGAAWDAAAWAKALGAGVGALLGAALSARGRTMR